MNNKYITFYNIQDTFMLSQILRFNVREHSS